MNKQETARYVRQKWLEDRAVFDADLLNNIASLPTLKDIETFCMEGFDEAVGKQLHWQSLISRAHRSPADLAEISTGGAFLRPPHVDLLNDVFVDATHNQRFYAVSMPTRLGKSFMMSQWGPAWHFCMFPNQAIIQASYALGVSRGFTLKVRNHIDHVSQAFFGLTLDGKAAGNFSFYDNDEGVVWAAAMNASITGKGGSLLVVDDPYNGVNQAYSPTYEAGIRETWAGTIRTRLNSGGSIILVMARWKEHDLTGWLIDQAKNSEIFDPWVEIKMPMEATENDILGRAPGDPLWPEKFGSDYITQLKESVGPITWAAQFQQSPLNSADSLFPLDKWDYTQADEVPPLQTVVRYWDLSAGGRRSDYVAGVLMGMDAKNNVYILDVKRKRFVTETADVDIKDYVRTTTMSDIKKYPSVYIFFEQAAGAGKAVSDDYMKTVFSGYNAEPHQKSGGKEANARGFASRQQGGGAYIVTQIGFDVEAAPEYQKSYDSLAEYTAPTWASEFIDELNVFPDPKYNDDQVDAASGAYQKLLTLMDDGPSAATITSVAEEMKKRQTKRPKAEKDILSQSTLARRFNTRGATVVRPRARR